MRDIIGKRGCLAFIRGQSKMDTIKYGHRRIGFIKQEINMDKIVYEKLVRDKIPEIISASGRRCDVRFLDDTEYLKMLETKLDEELIEYHKDHNLEELADLVEVINSIVKARGSSVEELEQIRKEKAEIRGGFSKKILLVSVYDIKR